LESVDSACELTFVHPESTTIISIHIKVKLKAV
jgi:hypothetical protein